MKAVIDTGTMISLSGTCLMNVFKSFVEANKIELIVSQSVADESVWRPITNKRFALSAARIKYAFEQKIVTIIPSTDEIKREQNRILKMANNIFFMKGKAVTLIQLGEAEALALARLFDAKALFVDERTTRSLIENPSRLREVLERRLDTTFEVDEQALLDFRQLFLGLKIFRSVDIIAAAFEQDLFDHELAHGKVEIEAALYAIKFAGCSVSEREIGDYITALFPQK